MYLKSLVDCTDEDLKEAIDKTEQLIDNSTVMGKFWLLLWIDYNREFMRRWKLRHPRKYGRCYAGKKWGYIG